MALNRILTLHSLKLECPFTWDIFYDERFFDARVCDNWNAQINKEFYPLITLMYDIMTAHAQINTENRNVEDVKKTLEKCDEDMAYLEAQNHPEIPIRVPEHILRATKAHVYHELDLNDEFERLRDDLRNFDLEDSKSKSTLSACKSQAWMRVDIKRSFAFIQQAIEENPNNDLWHFIVGKELRHIRRCTSTRKEASDKEMDCFKKAYEISRYHFYGLCLAQVKRENGLVKEARDLYDQVFDSINFESNDLNSRILLKLALGFIRFKKLDRAKTCLDKASERISERCPTFKLFNQYYGIYHMEKKQFKEALPYLEKAQSSTSLAIDKDYFKCKMKCDREFSLPQFLEGMLNKYKNLDDSQKQFIHIELGFCYWKLEREELKALDHFLLAFKINKDAEVLKNYVPSVYEDFKDNNVIHTMLGYFIPELSLKIRSKKGMFPKLEELQNICNDILQTFTQDELNYC